MNKLEKDLLNHENEVKELKNKIDIKDKSIDDLRYKLNRANNRIYDLEDQILKLEKLVDYFKRLWKNFLKFLKDKFFHSNDYDEIINELQDNDILNEDDINVNHGKEKDDLEFLIGVCK